ncbi:unnamed protein product [Spirodela intermedia]|uniref:Uncharacterized protein n=1 Tax=Spirodela intermedia TaxID=51605 RepID=A0A7I8KDL0_SPIIN|nr:unnamed protein product [Spirodela intermedia]
MKIEERRMWKEMLEKRREKVKKGWMVVSVGLDDGGGTTLRRFMIPISYLRHPLFRGLLEAAQDVYGFPSTGPLKLPCSVDDFLHLRWLIERELPTAGDHRHRHIRSFPSHSC